MACDLAFLVWAFPAACSLAVLVLAVALLLSLIVVGCLLLYFVRAELLIVLV